MHNDFLGIPLPDHVSYTNTKVNKIFKRTRYYEHCFSKKRRSEIVKSEKRKMANYNNQKLCFYCNRFNHRQDECRARIQDKQPCTGSKGRKYWPKKYTDEETTQKTSPISALTNYVTPLIGSRSVVPQLILNLCLASLMTCNKLYKIFAPGEKVRTRVHVKTGNQTTSWLFDTGAAITCMNSQSFNAAFGTQKPKKMANSQSCVAASGDAMNSIGVYEVDLWIKRTVIYSPSERHQ